MKKKPDYKKIIGTIVTVLLAAILIALFFAVGKVLVQLGKGQTPSLLGYRFYYVMTDSMTPTYAVGDVLLGKVTTEKDVDQYVPGQVITYTAESGEKKGKQITHRIEQGVTYDETLGENVVYTRGDKEGAPLDSPVRVSCINAIIVRKLVFVSWLYSLMQNGTWFFALMIIPMAVMLVVLVVRLALAIKKPQEEEEKAPETEETDEEKARRIQEIKQKAIDEYVEQQKKEGKD